MAEITAIKILNGKETYSAVLGGTFMCPDGKDRTVRSIGYDLRSKLVGIMCDDYVEISVPMYNCMIQWK